MSFNRRVNLTNERYNRLLRLAELNPVSYNYEKDLQLEYGSYLSKDIKEDFLTQVSVLANLRILTHPHRMKRGQVYGQTLTVTVGQPVRLDLLEPHNSTGLTVPLVIAPRAAVWWTKITNTGTGSLYYSLNVQDTGSVLLPANAAPAVHTADRETWEVINLRAAGDSAVVNVAVEV